MAFYLGLLECFLKFVAFLEKAGFELEFIEFSFFAEREIFCAFFGLVFCAFFVSLGLGFLGKFSVLFKAFMLFLGSKLAKNRAIYHTRQPKIPPFAFF